MYSRREREVMEILFAGGELGVQEVLEAMGDPPSYSAVRALLTTMAAKGYVKTRKESRRFVYRPAESGKLAKRSALQRMMATFFEGKPEKLVASLLDPKEANLSSEEIDRIRQLIEKGEGK